LGELIPPERRGRFFGRRDRIAVAVQLASILIAGLTLSAARPAGYERAGFAVVFGLALTARLFSVYHLSRLVEPPYPAPPSHERFSLLDFVRSSPWANFGRFSIYMAIFLAATNMAAPYFAPFMLKDLHFDYGDFTLASCAFLTAQSVTLTNWGRVADRFGSRRVLQFTGLGLPLVPILWLVSTHLVFILVIQLIAGFLWAGFYLSAANFFFDAVPPTKRTRSVAYHSAFTNTGMVVGALTGGWIAEHLPAELPGKLAPLFPRLELISPLQVIFLASGLVRLLVSLSLLPKIREAREVPAVSHWQVIVQIIGLTAIRGMLVSVFTGVHPSETPAPPPVKQREPPRSS
jgi:MFS family permease